MATATSQAAQAWLQAQKLRKHLLRQLEKMQKDSTSSVDLSQFEAVDGLLEKLRLACVQTIFLDFEYAVSENTEQALWSLHTSINTEYRRSLGRLKNSSNAVERRKVEKMYNNYLRIAQKFYKGYIQRLSARYDVRELKRVAQGIDVEQMTAEDVISPVSQDLSAKVLNSCHATLIRLGDLARYRIQARHKKSGYETALTYYSLAQDLMPGSGFAFHQMSIVNLDEGNHLDVVYHLYRAWAVAKPHPNAKTNLESRFKTLQAMNSASSRHGPSTPQDVFVMWFVKLHALFYKGETFTQHEELEGEVLHRLEMTTRDPAPAAMLLKMTLVNISAHHIALSRCEQAQNASTLRFYQYIHRLNIRFIQTLGTALEKRLREMEQTDPQGASDESANDKATTAVEALLPTLRVYLMWLVARRQELFAPGNDGHPGAMMTMAVRTLVQVFTLLCAQIYKENKPDTCPYLLMEDLEIRGLQPLVPEQLPEGCRLYYGQDGLTKPHPPSAELQLDAKRQRIARIFDILRCAVYMSDEPAIPVVNRVEDGRVLFEYQLQTAAHPAPNGTTTTPPAKETTQADHAKHGAARVERQAEPVLPTGQRRDPEHPRANHEQATGPQGFTLSAADTTGATAEEGTAEETVYNMLAPFLKPPTPQQQTGRSAAPQTMPEMQGAAPASRRTSMNPEPSPTGSIRPGKFEPLPWNWVYSPTPHFAEEMPSPTSQQFPGNYSPNQYQSYKASDFHGGMAEDPFVYHGPQRTSVFRGSQAQNNNLHAVPNAASAADEAHRQHLLQSFANGGGSSSSTGGASGIGPRTSIFSSWGHNPINPLQQTAGAAPAPSPWGQQGLGVPISSGSVFSQSSSLYHGTPANGMVNTSAHPDDPVPYSPIVYRRHPQRSPAEQTTARYDAAVFAAAFQ